MYYLTIPLKPHSRKINVCFGPQIVLSEVFSDNDSCNSNAVLCLLLYCKLVSPLRRGRNYPLLIEVWIPEATAYVRNNKTVPTRIIKATLVGMRGQKQYIPLCFHINLQCSIYYSLKLISWGIIDRGKCFNSFQEYSRELLCVSSHVFKNVFFVNYFLLKIANNFFTYVSERILREIIICDWELA